MRDPIDEFRAALLALSDDPSALNVARYLAASRALARWETGRRRIPAAEQHSRRARARQLAAPLG
jgi:hypothetical protein